MGVGDKMFTKRTRTYEWAIAQVLRYIRKGLGLSMREVAEAIQVSEQSIGRLERGEHFPREGMNVLKKLSEYYGISMSVIFSEADRVFDGKLPSIDLDMAIESKTRSISTDSLTKPSANREFAGIVGFQKILP